MCIENTIYPPVSFVSRDLRSHALHTIPTLKRHILSLSYLFSVCIGASTAIFFHYFFFSVFVLLDRGRVVGWRSIAEEIEQRVPQSIMHGTGGETFEVLSLLRALHEHLPVVLIWKDAPLFLRHMTVDGPCTTSTYLKSHRSLITFPFPSYLSTFYCHPGCLSLSSCRVFSAGQMLPLVLTHFPPDTRLHPWRGVYLGPHLYLFNFLLTDIWTRIRLRTSLR